MEYQKNQNENIDQTKKVEDRKRPNGKSNGQDKKSSITRIGGKNRGNAGNQAAAAKAKEPQKEKQAAESADSRQSKMAKKGGRPHYESVNRPVRTKREETIEDIRADIEQLEKDIQFEIRQIRSIKLGL